MERVEEIVIDRRKRLLLELLWQTSAEGEAHLSLRDMASALSLTKTQARRIVKLLEADGLVCGRARFREDGRQLANGYAITPRGRLRLGVGREERSGS